MTATVYIRLPLEDAVLVVELVEELGDLTPEEAEVVARVRRRIDGWRAGV